MTKKIEFKVVSNKNNFLHEDFKMKIPSLNQEFTFDTYYFALGKSTENEMQLISIVSNYLNRCKDAVLQLLANEIIYLPVDFSDQYYGAFKVTRTNSGFFKFEYGSVLKTKNVFYEKTDKFSKIIINDEIFDIEFELQLTISDILDSFCLMQAHVNQYPAQE